jgi:hypothetical protein
VACIDRDDDVATRIDRCMRGANGHGRVGATGVTATTFGTARARGLAGNVEYEAMTLRRQRALATLVRMVTGPVTSKTRRIPLCGSLPERMDVTTPSARAAST